MKNNILFFSLLLVGFLSLNAQIDTSGYSTWKPLYNSMKTWEDGAFNMNQTGHPDYGWGIYNNLTHNLAGDSIYLMKLQNGTFRQFMIESKMSMANIYNFRFADLNGENEVIVQGDCSGFTDKLFYYYSIQNQEFADRDPVKEQWNLLLTKFTDTSINYSVTGFLLNEGTSVSVYHAPDKETAVSAGLADTTVFSEDIAIIGNSWYKLSGMSIVPLDTMVYFIKTPGMDIFKMQVTFFESGISGNGRVGIVKQKLHPSPGDPVNDTLVMGKSYVNDVYYGLTAGVVKESSRSSWDIGFKTNVFSASVISNSTMGVMIYTYPKGDISGWLQTSNRFPLVDQAVVFPNPAKDRIRIYNNLWNTENKSHIFIYNTAGQLVLNSVHDTNGGYMDVNLEQLPEGMYQIRIVNNNRNYFSRVLVSR